MPFSLKDHKAKKTTVNKEFPFFYPGIGNFDVFCEHGDEEVNFRSLQKFGYCHVLKVFQQEEELTTGYLAYSSGKVPPTAEYVTLLTDTESTEEEKPSNPASDARAKVKKVDDDFNPELANNYLKVNIEALLQHLVDLGITNSFKKLTTGNITNYQELNELARRTDCVKTITLEIFACAASEYLGVVKDLDIVREALSNSKWCEYRLSVSSAGVLCKRVMDEVDPRGEYDDLFSMSEREIIEKAAAENWSIEAARKISDKSLVIATIYHEVNKIDIGKFYMGNRAKGRSTALFLQKIRTLFERINETDDSLVRMEDALSKDEVYAEYATRISKEMRTRINDSKKTRIEEWKVSQVRSRRTEKYLSKITKGLPATIKDSEIEHSELKRVKAKTLYPVIDNLTISPLPEKSDSAVEGDVPTVDEEPRDDPGFPEHDVGDEINRMRMYLEAYDEGVRKSKEKLAST